MGRLYPIIDETASVRLELDVIRVFSAVLAGKPDLVQYRAKEGSDGAILGRLRALVQERDRLSPQTLVFANDRADLALLAHVDGVHVGQTDMPVALVRQHYPGLRVGISTHNREQLEAALVARPDYVAIGPVFETGSKANPEPTVGLIQLRELGQLAQRAGIRSVAIGGITQERLPAVLAEVGYAAVISALLGHGSREADPYGGIAASVRSLNFAAADAD
jgi:thiamine-phosphate pyrophosphorylase